MQLIFNSVEELKAFVKDELKGSRRGKGDGEPDSAAGSAPNPIMPPAGTAAASFAQGFPTAAAPSQGFPTAHAGADPAILGMLGRVSAAIDKQLAAGSDPNNALNWFRQQCGPDAASATMDQIKAVFLPRLPMAALESICKLVGG